MSGNQEENAYDEYQYRGHQRELTQANASNSAPYQDLDSIGLIASPSASASISQDPFAIDTGAGFFPSSSDTRLSSLGDTYPAGDSAQWNFPVGSGASDFVLSPPDIASPVNLASDDFGTPWSVPNMRLETQESNSFGFPPHQGTISSPMDDQQLDSFSMAGPSIAESAAATSPVSSHEASGSVDGVRPRTAIRRPKHSNTGGDTSSSNSSHQSSRLRSAAQSSRAPIHKPGETDQDRAARTSHNLVERNYRTRLNAEYEKLLAAVPAPPDDKKISKHEVLELARERIRSLETECEERKKENSGLKRRIDELVSGYQDTSQGWTDDADLEIPEDRSSNPQ